MNLASIWRWTSSVFRIPFSRWVKLLVGLAFVGIGIAFTKQANLGLGPSNVLNDGLAQRTGIQLGTASIVIGVLVMLFWIPFREKPGIGTVTNLLLIGVFMDLALAIVRSANGLFLRSVWLIAGLLLAAIGSVLYLGSQLGAGPRDGLMLGLRRKTGWSVHLTRTALEISVLVAGWLLGGAVGIGTVLFALAIGPMIHLMASMTGVELGKANIKTVDVRGCCGY